KHTKPHKSQFNHSMIIKAQAWNGTPTHTHTHTHKHTEKDTHTHTHTHTHTLPLRDTHTKGGVSRPSRGRGHHGGAQSPRRPARKQPQRIQVQARDQV